MLRVVCAGCALILATALTHAFSQPVYEENLPLEHPAIRYGTGPSRDPVATLAARLQSGETRLDVDPRHGILPSLLKHLGIDTDSQGLVFSKTSFQHALISPRVPRAVYFNDDIAVAVVPGASAIELAAVDPGQGAQFYALTGRASATPTIARRDVCLKCHHGVATAGVPGMFVSSVFPSASGTPEQEGAIVTDHRTAFEDRWGGWYVTGTHGGMRHRGNAVARNPAEPTSLDSTGAHNVASLVGKFDLRAYLAPTSDIVALMTFEHQTFMQNLLTRLAWESRIAEHDGGKALTARVEARVEEVVRYMTFADEPPLPSAVVGTSTFARTFQARGPVDERGRSLREFDLRQRLFRYPVSYVIYSRAFEGLPAGVRAAVYRRLYDTLVARGAVDAIAIVRETGRDLPGFWK